MSAASDAMPGPPGPDRRPAYPIDPDGIIRKAYEVTDTGGFAQQVLDDLQPLRRQ
jgi:hypothetical protein